jgi:hypothetical protein
MTESKGIEKFHHTGQPKPESVTDPRMGEINRMGAGVCQKMSGMGGGGPGNTDKGGGHSGQQGRSGD